ncbi:hypothetical protein GK047_12810 [Paenibacillus sp. SYP-B3998]|uniref:Uncharacterized protein n=1 Tax=Paenibacillus sp. SYP-B3998 TaxID=2678564 RepID=A0A6G3ZYW3_9BACL|nr:hypothetical protein [Paenibacillus sp. SYP-B3998]NEW06884.1 hypothetical protein [Paenibacillus sp. SYP-B3998]
MLITELEATLNAGMSGEEFTLPDVSSNELNALIQTFIPDRLMLNDASIQMQNESSILIRGQSKVNILGLAKPLVALEFFLVADKPECTIGVKLPDGGEPANIATWLRNTLSIFQSSYKMYNSGLVFASVDNLTFPPNLFTVHPDSATKGTSFFSALDIEGQPITLLQSIFGTLNPLVLSTPFTSEVFSGPIEVKVPSDPPDMGSLKLSNPRIIIKADSLQLRTTLKLDIQNDSLFLDGGGAVLPNGTFEFTCALTGVKKQGQEMAETTGWTDPFGFSGITIQKFGVGIALGTTGTEISLSGEIAIGEEGSADQIIMEAGVKFINGQVPSALLASLRASSSSQDGIPLSRLVEYFTKMPVGDFVLLKEVKIKDLTMYVVADPDGFEPPSDPGKIYRGLAMNAEVSLFGLACRALIEFQQNRGVKAEGELGIIDLGGVLRITDETGTKGPFFIIDSTQTSELTEEFGYIHLSAKMSLFGLTQSVAIKAAQDTFECTLGFSVNRLADFHLSCRLSGKESFVGQAALMFKFMDQSIELKRNGITIATYTLGTKVTGKLFVSLTQETFLLEVAANLELPGLPVLNVNLKFNEAIQNLDVITEDILRSIMSQAEEHYKATLLDPITLVNLFKLDGLKPAQIAEKLKELNFPASKIAKGLHSLGLTPQGKLVSLLKAVFPDDVGEVAEALTEVWDDITAINMAKLLNYADYSYPEIGKGIQDTLKTNIPDLGKAFKALSPKMDVIEDGIRSVFNNVSNEEIAECFNKIGFEPADIASHAKNKWEWDTNKMGDVFVNLELKREEIIQAMTEANFPLPELASLNAKLNLLPKPGGTVGEFVERFPSLRG